jgi:hypothetical protein
MRDFDVGAIMDKLDDAFDLIDEVINDLRTMGFRSKAEEVSRYATHAYEVAVDTLEDYERE